MEDEEQDALNQMIMAELKRQETLNYNNEMTHNEINGTEENTREIVDELSLREITEADKTYSKTGRSPRSLSLAPTVPKIRCEKRSDLGKGKFYFNLI